MTFTKAEILSMFFLGWLLSGVLLYFAINGFPQKTPPQTPINYSKQDECKRNRIYYDKVRKIMNAKPQLDNQ